jgi:hypothetical protein
LIAQSDAVLLLNHPKNGVEGYIGASALMETGVAAYLGKKIFILNPLNPTERYKYEFNFLGGVVIDGDLGLIG